MKEKKINYSKTGEIIYLENRIKILSSYLEDQEKMVNVIRKRKIEVENQLKDLKEERERMYNIYSNVLIH